MEDNVHSIDSIGGISIPDLTGRLFDFMKVVIMIGSECRDFTCPSGCVVMVFDENLCTPRMVHRISQFPPITKSSWVYDDALRGGEALVRFRDLHRREHPTFVLGTQFPEGSVSPCAHGSIILPNQGVILSIAGLPNAWRSAACLGFVGSACAWIDHYKEAVPLAVIAQCTEELAVIRARYAAE